MIDTPLFTGALIRLEPLNPERDAETIARWTHDPRYPMQWGDRVVLPLPAGLVKKQLEELLRRAEKDRCALAFSVRSREDDRMLGIATLEDILWMHGTARLFLWFGDPACWENGCAAECLRLIRHYAFFELNLYRIDTRAYDGNAHIVQALREAGYAEEVRNREALFRDGRRWDWLLLGLLREPAPPVVEPTAAPVQPRGLPAGLPYCTGELVRLIVPEKDTTAQLISRWSQDTEYHRLLDSGPAYPLLAGRVRETYDEWLSGERNSLFAIQTLADDRLVGMIDTDITQWHNADAYIGISIGERADRGKGYGTDAMRVLLGTGFTHMNLHRMSLNVYEYNPRALRSYLKAGFVVEGRLRQRINREGKRWDSIYMGVLRSEWEGLAR